MSNESLQMTASFEDRSRAETKYLVDNQRNRLVRSVLDAELRLVMLTLMDRV